MVAVAPTAVAHDERIAHVAAAVVAVVAAVAVAAAIAATVGVLTAAVRDRCPRARESAEAL